MAEQKRVMLWCVPRSGSTAFLRCMSNRNDVKAFREMFVACRFFGPNAANPEVAQEMNASIENEFTYKQVQAKLERDYDVPIVFAKDGAKSIFGHFDCIPKGFTHTFLIKNPTNIHMSKNALFDNAMKSFGRNDATYNQTIETKHAGSPFYEMLELVKHVRDELKQEITIIDGDDLLTNPEGTMKKWCEVVGIPFRPEMMSWEENGEVKWEMSEGHKKFMDVFPEASKNAFGSKCFNSRVATDYSNKEIPEIVKRCIEASEPYYKELYAMKMSIE